MAAKTPNVTRVRIAREELDKMSKEQLQKCWNLQEQYVDLLENKLQSNSEHTELMSLRESEEKLKQQQIDASRRENILVMRLTTKEHEMQEFAGQIQELKQAQVPTIAQLRSSMLDPAVNLLFEKMKKEVDTLKARLREMQDEFNAWKFTPDSNTGKRLMAKCRLLYQENEELGKIISSGRMAKLEGDLALQKSFSEEMKKSQAELDEFLLELDEDVEGMQSTIYYLQQQLREAKEQIAQLHRDKLEQSGIANGLSPISHSVSTPDNKRKSPMPQIRSENGQPTSTPSSHSISIKTEVNGTNPGEIKSEVLSDEEESHSPVAKDCSDPKAGEKSQLTNSISSMSKEVASKDGTTTQISGAIAQSVIVENKSSINHEKQVPLIERTNLIVDATSASDSKRTSDQILEQPAANDVSDAPKDSQQQKSNKRTPEGGRGRKRTRPRTPDPIKEDSLPVRKRTRRREAEMLAADAIEEKRTPVEIDIDTEVSVAETLASWAAAKLQERTEIKTELEDLGNGELNRMDEDK